MVIDSVVNEPGGCHRATTGHLWQTQRTQIVSANFLHHWHSTALKLELNVQILRQFQRNI